jgi:hypothetical protein
MMFRECSHGSVGNIGGLLNVMPESVGARGDFLGRPTMTSKPCLYKKGLRRASGTESTWAPGIHRARSLRWLSFSGSRAVISASMRMMVMTRRGMPVRLGAAR